MLVGVVGTLLLAWTGWASNTLLDHISRIIRVEMSAERIAIIDQKVDLLLMERGIPNPHPSPRTESTPKSVAKPERPTN
jgi:hypothetical protein